MAETIEVPEIPAAPETVVPPPAKEPVVPDAAPTAKELELAAALKTANAESAARRRELDALKAAEEKRKDAALTKEQLAAKLAADAQAQAAQVAADAQKKLQDADEKIKKSAYLLKAQKMGFENPGDAFALADKSVKPNTDGEYDEASIEAMLKPLIGRLPIKTQGSGIGTPSLRRPNELTTPTAATTKSGRPTRY